VTALPVINTPPAGIRSTMCRKTGHMPHPHPMHP
jgi:hypothetical protein